jgi:hypothetical protein
LDIGYSRLDIPGWTLDIKEKSPSAVTAEEDIPKTDYIFISSALCRDKFKLFCPFGARHSVAFLKSQQIREGLRIIFELLAVRIKRNIVNVHAKVTPVSIF